MIRFPKPYNNRSKKKLQDFLYNIQGLRSTTNLNLIKVQTWNDCQHPLKNWLHLEMAHKLFQCLKFTESERSIACRIQNVDIIFI